MTDLTIYFGNEYVRDIVSKARTNSKEFILQSGATKLQLVDKIKVENETYKLATAELIDALDEEAANNELSMKTLKEYEKALGTKNEEFIKSHNITVTRTDEKLHAKNALLNHMKKHYSKQLKER